MLNVVFILMLILGNFYKFANDIWESFPKFNIKILSIMSKFRTKIKQIGDSDLFELFLPNGLRVACGSLEHCWNERDHWESSLSSGVQLELF